jgi:hypothetical protein
VCELGFQYITDTDIVGAATKQKGEGGENESEKGESACISHSMALQSVDTSLDHMYQRGLNTFTLQQPGEIRIAMRMCPKFTKPCNH